MKKIMLILVVFTYTLLANNAILSINTGGHTAQITDVIVSKNKDIISSSHDNSIRVWDSKSGKEKRKFLGEIYEDTKGPIYSIALSPDEKYLAVGGFLGKAGDGKSGRIRIYDYHSGILLTLLKSHSDVIYDLDFSSDGKYLLSCSADKNITLWDISSLRTNIKQSIQPLRTIVFHTAVVKSIKFGKNNTIISAGYDNKIALHSFDGKLLNEYNYTYPLRNIATNQDEIAIAGKGYEILIFDMDLNIKKKILSETDPLGVAYSPNKKYLIAGIGDQKGNNNVNIYDAKNAYIKISYFDKHTDSAGVVAFLDNRIAISCGGDKHEIYLWDISSSNKSNKSPHFIHNNEIKNKIGGKSQCVWSVGIDGDNIAWGNTWTNDSHTLGSNLRKSFNFKNFIIETITNPSHHNFKRIEYNGLTHGKRHNIFWEENNEHSDSTLLVKSTNTLITKNDTNGYGHTCYGWYKDFIISGGGNGIMIIYDKMGNEIAKLLGHTDEIWSIALDGDKLVSGSADQTIKIWDLSILQKGVKTILPTLSLFVGTDNEWVMWTKDGFFDASKNGAKFIGYHINQGDNKEAEFITVESLYSTFYRPDLIKKVLNGKNIDSYAKNININKLLQDGLAPEVHILTKTANTTNQDLDLKMQVCPKGNGGYDNLTLMLNDVSISIIDKSRALTLKRKSENREDCFVYNQTISLRGGINNIGFKATNKAGNIESKADYIEMTYNNTNIIKSIDDKKFQQIGKSTKESNLHILTIAINDYKDKTLKLKYSINDATQMLKTIENVAKPLFKNIYSYTLFDKEATKENIKSVFEKINASNNDVFLLYIAGHGITDEYNGNYYYIPYDFINNDKQNSVQTQGIGQKDFMIGLSKINALKSLVLLDTCNSGSFVEAELQKTTTNKLAKATGRATISASSKFQVALEGFNNHGAFTYTLLEALNGNGYNKDNTISTNELSEYVERILPNRTYKKWGYKQIPQKSIYGVDFHLGKK